MILAITPIRLLSRDQSWVQFSERCKPLTWLDQNRREKEHVFVSLTSMSSVKSCSQLFPTRKKELLRATCCWTDSEVHPCEYRPQTADGGLKTIAPHSNSSCSQLWSILMCVSEYIYTFVHAHAYRTPFPPQKIGCHMLWHTRSRPRHLRVGLKGNPPFLNEDVFSLAWAPNSWVQIGVGQHCRPPPVCLIVFEHAKWPAMGVRALHGFNPSHLIFV